MPVALEPRDELSAFLDDELSDEERAELEEALASDPSLRAEHDELNELVADLRSLGAVDAPPNFLAGVLARVEAGEGIGEPLFADEDAGLRVVPDVAREQPPDNVVRLPWWLKGPALTAVAALLIVGVGYQMRGGGLGEPPSASSVAMRPATDAAPMPTGAAADDLDGMDMDILASAEEAPAAERLRMEAPAGESVAVGGAGGAAMRAPAPAARPRASGISEARGAPPPGIIVGNFDRGDVGDYAPEPKAAEADEASELLPSDPGGAALAMAPAAKADGGDRPAMAAIAQLLTSDSQSILQIRDAVEARGWTIRFVSPPDGPVVLSDALTEQVVELIVPTGSEATAQGILEGRGTFTISTTPSASDADASRLRVTIIYRP